MLNEIKPYDIFRNSNLDKELWTNGYVKASANGLINFTKIIQFIDSLDLNNYLNQYSTFLSIYISEIEFRNEIQNFIALNMERLLENFFVNYKIRASILIIKPPNSKNKFPIHQDPTICDERNFSSLNLWIPLEETNHKNGTLCLRKKSHKKYNFLRGESLKKKEINILDSLLMTEVKVKKGEFLIFDPRTLHGSNINRTDSSRKVLFISLSHQNAPITTPVRIKDSTKIWLKKQPSNYFNVCNDFVNCHIDNYDYHLKDSDVIDQEDNG